MERGARELALPGRTDLDRNASPPPLRIDVLGTLTVFRGDAPVDVGPAMVRNLLAVLALNVDRAVSCERIVRVLWGGNPPPTSRNLVHGYVSRLRSQLKDPSCSAKEDVVVRDGPGYRLLVDADAVDLVRFDRLRRSAHRAARENRRTDAVADFERAFACWKGEVLEDIDSRIRRLPSITAITHRRIDSVCEYAILCRSLGLRASALEQLRRVADVAPLHENLHACLMATLNDVGNRAGALQVYASIRQGLAGELGVDPGSELQSVYLRILREGEDPASQDPVPLHAAPSPPAGRDAGPGSPVGHEGPVPASPQDPRVASAPARPVSSRGPWWPHLLVAIVGAIVVLLGVRPLLPAGTRGERAGTLLFFDDFDGTGLDAERWATYEEIFPNKSSWSRSAVAVKDDELQITGSGKDPTGSGNTAGGLCLCRKEELIRKYGEWQVRARFDTGAGYAPVIGLFPSTNNVDDGYMTLAYVDRPDRKGTSVLIKGKSGKERSVPLLKADLTEWHTYAIEWRPDFVKIHLDGETVFDSNSLPEKVDLPATPMYFYMQMELGPSRSIPKADSETPDHVVMHVDWVKHYW